MNQALRAAVVFSAFAWQAIAVDWTSAAPPTISSLSPRAVRPGETQEIVLQGGGLAGASQLWTSFPSKAVLTPLPSGNGKNSASATFRVTVEHGTGPGIYAARVATATGISPLFMLLVDDLPSLAQQAANISPSTAQTVKLPVAVDGVIEPLVRRYYKFHAERGQRVAIEVFARRIGSPLDPTIRLLDASGREITYCDDLPGLSEDAALNYTFSKSGEYVVELGDNLYQGGGNYVYRLRMGDFPAAVVAMPLAATRGSEATFRFTDLGGEEVEPARVSIPSDPLLFAMNVPARLHGRASHGFAPVLLSDRSEFNEAEPNDDVGKANRVDPHANINGRLQSPGDVDHFVFAAKAGQSLRFTSISRQLGSPADVVLRVTKIGGGQIGYAEGTGPVEASLSAYFPTAGDYQLEVHDLNRRGGPRHAYHVDISPAEENFTLSASTDTSNIPVGGTAIVTVEAVRNGYRGAIAVRAVDLPAGIVSVPTVIGPGQNSSVLSLKSSADARSGRVHPIRIIGSGRNGKVALEASATITDALKAQWSEMPYPPVALSTAAAVGIAPAAGFTLHTEPAQLVFGHRLSASVKVIAERQKGFDDEIALVLVHEKPAGPPVKGAKVLESLPAGVTVTLKAIPKGSSSAEITFRGDDKTRLGEYTAVVLGRMKKGNETLAEPAPGIGLKLDVPFHVSVEPAKAKVARGGQVKLKILVDRNPAFHGTIALACSRLPKGLTATGITLQTSAAAAELVVSATPEAARGPLQNVSVVGEASVGGSKYSTRTPLRNIAVE